MKTKLSLLIASSLIVATASFGAPEGKGRGNPFAKADADGDGVLSKSEFVSARVAGMQKRAESAGKEFDASKAEARLGRMFANADANADGSIDADEFAAAAGPGAKGAGKKAGNE